MHVSGPTNPLLLVHLPDCQSVKFLSVQHISNQILFLEKRKEGKKLQKQREGSNAVDGQ